MAPAQRPSSVTGNADVVIIGGAIIGSAAAYFLSENPDFDGSIVVVEPDPSYERAQSTRSGNSIREQFSNPVNIRISQFGMEFIRDFHDNVAVDGAAPLIDFRGTGYLFLSENRDHFADLAADHATQVAEGARVRLLSAADVAAEFPYMDTDTLIGARVGSTCEGSFDAWALLQGLRGRAEHNGVTYVKDTVVELDKVNGRVTTALLASGARIGCGHVVNAAGTRARLIAAMAGLGLPVEPRARTTFVFSCATPIDHNVPLTVTPEGVHFRRERNDYVTGVVPLDDRPVDYDDLRVRRDEFDDLIWPVLAKYVPRFDRVKVVTAWGGQYAFNVLDHNLVIGPHPDVENFLFANGFSGHGLQQAPAVGRGVSELITYGRYRTLDMGELGYDRVLRNEPFSENVVI